ncbi:uncharacterized protein [Henckelia pumila]|uniref:uncharacterized protein n=1 Tax=Henckelia pumila TaxID=405737 RepID=UPI003C6E2A4B
MDALVFCVLCLLVPLISAEPIRKFHYTCGSTDMIEIKGIDVSPYPVTIGQTTTVKIDAEAFEDVSIGEVLLYVTLNQKKLYGSTKSLCDQPTDCSIPSGPFSFSITQTLPQLIPVLNGYEIEVYDVDGSKMVCFYFDVNVKVVDLPAVVEKLP